VQGLPRRAIRPTAPSPNRRSRAGKSFPISGSDHAAIRTVWLALSTTQNETDGVAMMSAAARAMAPSTSS
jgi:hypothetical protein